MSTILGLTVGKGNTPAQVVSYLRRSAGADGTAPEGTVYFAKTDDAARMTRAGWFDSAVTELNNMGVRAEIITSVVPQAKKDVAGAMLGFAFHDWTQSNSTILPGAIVENFTSFAQRYPKPTSKRSLRVFWRPAPAGSSGTAIEPYNPPQKFPHPFLHVHYARGCTDSFKVSEIASAH